MGSADAAGFAQDGEGPVREVTMRGFEVAAHAVTNAQFADFVAATGFVSEAERCNWSFVFHGSVPDLGEAPDSAGAGADALVASRPARLLGTA